MIIHEPCQPGIPDAVAVNLPTPLALLRFIAASHCLEHEAYYILQNLKVRIPA